MCPILKACTGKGTHAITLLSACMCIISSCRLPNCFSFFELVEVGMIQTSEAIVWELFHHVACHNHKPCFLWTDGSWYNMNFAIFWAQMENSICAKKNQNRKGLGNNQPQPKRRAPLNTITWGRWYHTLTLHPSCAWIARCRHHTLSNLSQSLSSFLGCFPTNCMVCYHLSLP